MFLLPPTQMHEHARSITCQCCKEYLHHIICLPFDRWTSLAPIFAALLASLTPSHLEIDHSEECLNVKARNNYKHPMHSQTLLKLAGPESTQRRQRSSVPSYSRAEDELIHRGDREVSFAVLQQLGAKQEKKTFYRETPGISALSDRKTFSPFEKSSWIVLFVRPTLHACLCFVPLGDAIAQW